MVRASLGGLVDHRVLLCLDHLIMIPLLVAFFVQRGWGLLSVISSSNIGNILCGSVRTIFSVWLTNRDVTF